MKVWTFYYEGQQIVILSRPPFIVYIMATPSAKNSALSSLLDSHLKPVLNELESIHTQIVATIPSSGDNASSYN